MVKNNFKGFDPAIKLRNQIEERLDWFFEDLKELRLQNKLKFNDENRIYLQAQNNTLISEGLLAKSSPKRRA